MSEIPQQPPAPPPSSPTQPSVETTVTVYSGPPLDTIRSIIANQFQVKDAFLDPYGVPTILVAAEPPKQKFQNILTQLAGHHLLAALRGIGDTFTIKVFRKPQLSPPKRRINLILFMVTVVSVTIAGYFVWIASFTTPDPLLQSFHDIVAPGRSPVLEAAIFSGGLISIIGLHEFGHKAATVHHGLDATLPYFIPGPPPIGTFGALISLRGPPANRDQLFDLGLSGPVVGFLVTIIVGLMSFFLGTPTGPISDQLNNWYNSCVARFGNSPNCVGTISFPAQPLLLVILGQTYLRIGPPTVVEQQLFFAAQIGALLTFLNIVPAWQLDGGHISRAVFGPSGHRIATIVGILLLLVSGFLAFALLVLVMMGFSRRGFAGVEPLDDVSPVSWTRKGLYLVGIAMLVLTYASSPF